MRIKVSEAEGAVLDWLVAKAEGVGVEMLGRAVVIEGGTIRQLHYSTDWSQGGPIIERELVSVTASYPEYWSARILANLDEFEEAPISYGPTPLIAAMRCYVASKLGEEIDVPEELK